MRKIVGTANPKNPMIIQITLSFFASWNLPWSIASRTVFLRNIEDRKQMTIANRPNMPIASLPAPPSTAYSVRSMMAIKNHTKAITRNISSAHQANLRPSDTSLGNHGGECPDAKNEFIVLLIANASSNSSLLPPLAAALEYRDGHILSFPRPEASQHARLTCPKTPSGSLKLPGQPVDLAHGLQDHKRGDLEGHARHGIVGVAGLLRGLWQMAQVQPAQVGQPYGQPEPLAPAHPALYLPHRALLEHHLDERAERDYLPVLPREPGDDREAVMDRVRRCASAPPAPAPPPELARPHH